MTYIQLDNISFRYPEHHENIFSNLSAVVPHGSKIGLVGKNGEGKSTLLKILTKELKVNCGVQFVANDCRIGILGQKIDTDDEITVSDYLWQSNNKLYKLNTMITEAEAENGKTFSDYNFYNEFYEYGGIEFQNKLDNIVKQMCPNISLAQGIKTLSGGEKTKLSLARLLLQDRNLILLDEPTNHLDIETRIWLENFLQQIDISYIVVSHDQEFLDKCTNTTWKLESGKLHIEHGTFSQMIEQKQRIIENQLEKYKQQKIKIHTLQNSLKEKRNKASSIEKFKFSRSVKNNGGICKRDDGSGRSVSGNKMSKSATALQNRLTKMIETAETNRPLVEKTRKIMFPRPEIIPSKIAIEGKQLQKIFDRTIFKNLNFTIATGEKVAICGANGSGKTTLLKMISSMDQSYTGDLYLHHKANISYFCQEQTNLDNEKSAFENVCCGRHELISLSRTILGCLGLEKDNANKKVSALSIGERSKVSLAKVLLSGGNILILDEPTNHLDIFAKQMLAEALQNYDGTLIIVSHDRKFLNDITTSQISL